MSKEVSPEDKSRRLAWAAAALGAGATLTVAGRWAERRLAFKHAAERYTIPVGRLEADDLGETVTMRKVVAACLQYPAGATRQDIKDTLYREEDKTDRKQIGAAVFQLRRNGIIVPAVFGNPHEGIAVDPSFIAAVVDAPTEAQKLITQCAIYSLFPAPTDPMARESVVAALRELLPDPEASRQQLAIESL